MHFYKAWDTNGNLTKEAADNWCPSTQRYEDYQAHPFVGLVARYKRGMTLKYSKKPPKRLLYSKYCALTPEDYFNSFLFNIFRMIFDFQEGKKRGIFNKNVLHAIDAKHTFPVTCYGSIIGEDVRGIVAEWVE